MPRQPLTPEQMNIALGSQLAGQELQAKNQSPKQGDADAEIYKSLLESIQSKDRGWKGIFSSAARGMEAGARRASLLDRKKDLEKYEKVMDWLGATNQSMIERNQHFAKRDEAMRSLRPKVLAYAESATQMDAPRRELLARQMLDEWNQKTDSHMQFITLNANNPLEVVVSENGRAFPYNMSTLFAGDELVEKELARILPQAQLAEQAKAQQAQEELNIKREKLDQQATRNNLTQEKLDLSKDPKAQFELNKNRKLGEERAKEIITLRKNIDEAENKMQDISYLKNLLEKGQVITGNTLSSKAHRLFSTLSGDKALSDTELFDATAKTLFKFGLEQAKFGNMNMKEFEFLKEALPHSGKTKEAINKMLERTEQIMQRSVERAKKKLASGMDLNNSYSNSGSNNTIRAISPQGTPIEIPNDPQLIEQLIASGGQIVQ